MSFQRLDVKDAPLSEVTRLGTPKRLTQWWRKAEAAADEDGSDKGIAWTKRVVLHTAVSRYLYP